MRAGFEPRDRAHSPAELRQPQMTHCRVQSSSYSELETMSPEERQARCAMRSPLVLRSAVGSTR